MHLSHALAFALGLLILLPGATAAFDLLAPIVAMLGLTSSYWLVIPLLFASYLTTKRNWQSISLGLMLIAGLLHGVIAAQATMQRRLAAELSNQEFTLTGQIVDLPDVYPESTRFLFRVEQASIADASQSASLQSLMQLRQVRLSWYGAPPVTSGASWRLRVKLQRPHGLVNPGGFDFERYAATRGIDAVGYVLKASDNQLLAPAAGVDWWRMQISNAIARALTGETVTADANQSVSSSTALIQALAVGDTRQISDADWERYRRLGITHLIAISGLHVTLFATLGALLAYALLRIFPRLTRTAPRQQYCAAVGLLFASAYALLAGFNPPAMRTLLMLAAVLLGVLTRRVTTRWQGFALALLVLLLVDPFALLSAGVWLSFFAVAVLLISFSQRAPQPTALTSLWRTQLLMSIALLPLSLVFFQGTSALAPLVNLLAIPFFTLVVVPLCLASIVLLMVAPSLATLLLKLASELLDAAFALAGPWTHMAWADLRFATPNAISMILALLGVIICFAPVISRRQRLITIAFGIILMLPLFWRAPPTAIATGDVRLVLFDVGQGLSALIQTQHHQLLFDAGPGIPDGANVGNSVVNPSLLELGADRLSKIVLSHADQDHAGGLAAIRAQVPLAPIDTSAHAQISDAAPCIAGQQWTWDGVEFNYLHPNDGLPYLRNQSSCVLRVASKHGVILLPGDIDEVIEARLLRTQSALLDADVLIAPHHGSAKSSTTGFLQATSPKYVLYPVGNLNRFQFPRPETRARVQALGATEWLTSEQGAIQMQSTAQGWQLQREREISKPWWRNHSG
jgi:competence protein ComEC